MKKYFTVLLSIFLINSFEQPGTSKVKKSYCGDTSQCSIKDDPIHFDPYYNGHLCENFNPAQIDFSKEYYQLETKQYSNKSNKIKQAIKYDFSSIWPTDDEQQNGMIGVNYQRIQVHIDHVIQSELSNDIYLVSGKSKTGITICSFSGQIKLLKIFYTDCDDTKFKRCGELFASYTFYEDSTQIHSGVFKGITECSFYIDIPAGKAKLDESDDVADGYWNRTFIGTWKSYKTQQFEKCIWGDYRLPFVFDFMCGDGEMRACDKYVMNGWKSFNDQSEYVQVNPDKWTLKDKWWRVKK